MIMNGTTNNNYDNSTNNDDYYDYSVNTQDS